MQIKKNPKKQKPWKIHDEKSPEHCMMATFPVYTHDFWKFYTLLQGSCIFYSVVASTGLENKIQTKLAPPALKASSSQGHGDPVHAKPELLRGFVFHISLLVWFSM